MRSSRSRFFPGKLYLAYLLFFLHVNIVKNKLRSVAYKSYAQDRVSLVSYIRKLVQHWHFLLIWLIIIILRIALKGNQYFLPRDIVCSFFFLGGGKSSLYNLEEKYTYRWYAYSNMEENIHIDLLFFFFTFWLQKQVVPSFLSKEDYCHHPRLFAWQRFSVVGSSNWHCTRSHFSFSNPSSWGLYLLFSFMDASLLLLLCYLKIISTMLLL